VFLPISYVIFTIRLLISAFEQEDLAATVKRFSFLILYIIVGPWFLSITYVIDIFVFFGNLYTKPLIDEFKTDKHKVFKKESLILFEDTIDEIIKDLNAQKSEAAKKNEDLSVFLNKNGNLQC
jgi:hypothetical protein